MPVAIHSLYDLIWNMRTYGRQILFISLTNTLLTDVQATLIAAMVYNLRA